MAKRQASKTKYWLFKSEPEVFSIEDLRKSPKKTTCWDGVRNYQARNFMRDEMKKGDRVLFYHSNQKPPAVMGTATVVKEAYPDHTAWDQKDPHYDPKSSPDNPRWQMVDIKLDQIFDTPVTLDDIRETPALKEMGVIKKGNRLSIQPVTKSQFEQVVKMGGG